MERLVTTELVEQTRMPLSKRTVFIVDDNVDTLSLNREILEMSDYQVFTAQSGPEALAVLTEIEPPDLILLDMRLGRQSGLDLLNIIEEQHPLIVANVPIVFFTALDEVPPSKAMGMIRKPIDLDEFLSTVQRYIEKGVVRHG
jgi:two-component system sensor histidine kinase ChiS